LRDEAARDGRPAPPADLRWLLVFEIRVGREERLDLAQPVLREIVEIADLREARVAGRDSEDLLVVAALVAIGRAGTMQPGKVGSSTTTRASSGSPSPASVCITNP